MKVKVISKTEYTRKKDGVKTWRVTGLGDDGNVVAFYRPYDEQPVQGDEYKVILKYDAFKFTYNVGYEKVTK